MQFAGLVNEYSMLVKPNAYIWAPLYELLKDDTPFAWEVWQQTAFEALKAALTKGPAHAAQTRRALGDVHRCLRLCHWRYAVGKIPLGRAVHRCLPSPEAI